MLQIVFVRSLLLLVHLILYGIIDYLLIYCYNIVGIGDTSFAETGFQRDELAYIGDDVNDVEIMREIASEGLTACPRDATVFVEPYIYYRAHADGGYGAFRDFAEWLIRLRNS